MIESAATRPSAQGDFSAVTYTIRARDAAQDRRAVLADLKDIPGVLMVL